MFFCDLQYAQGKLAIYFIYDVVAPSTGYCLTMSKCVYNVTWAPCQHVKTANIFLNKDLFNITITLTIWI